MGDATSTGTARVIGTKGLDRLVAELRGLGYATRGPVVSDGAVMNGDLASAGELPVGCHDTQGPGRYELAASADGEVFGWAVGPGSLKGEFYPSRSTLWRTEGAPSVPVEFAAPAPGAPIAYVGARPCDLAALSILGRVLAGGEHPDGEFATRRAGAFIAVAECARPAATCFCASMGSGPGLEAGFDLALSELAGSLDPSAGGFRYLARAGSPAGEAVLAVLGGEAPSTADWAAREASLGHARAQMGGRLDPEGLAALLAASHEHPRWSEVAKRCLACGNCTMVCPTCFCSDVHDVTDLDGGVERTRRWASCFELSHSYLHGGAVRASTSSRYRQWMTHKLSSWHDQFGSSGCVGCGRCIAWCPVGIDITEEAAAIGAGSAQVGGSPGR